MVFTWDLEHSREWIGKRINAGPNPFGNLFVFPRRQYINVECSMETSECIPVIGGLCWMDSRRETHMLVNQDDGNVFPFLGEVVERFVNRRGFGLGIDYQEVTLGVWGICDMLLQKNTVLARVPQKPIFFFFSGIDHCTYTNARKKEARHRADNTEGSNRQQGS